jgi:hypothetical protein
MNTKPLFRFGMIGRVDRNGRKNLVVYTKTKRGTTYATEIVPATGALVGKSRRIFTAAGR